MTIFNWLVLILFTVPLWFFARAVKKAGFSPWWTLLGIVPFLNVVALWVFAYVKWPTLPEN